MRLDVQDVVIFNFLGASSFCAGIFSYCFVFCHFTLSCLMFNVVVFLFIFLFTSLFLSVYICMALFPRLYISISFLHLPLILFLSFSFPLSSFTSFCFVAAALSLISHSPLFCLAFFPSSPSPSPLSLFPSPSL